MMPTRIYEETVTRSEDLCDFCGKPAGSCGSHRCDICARLACVHHGHSDHHENLYHCYTQRTWLCQECNHVGQACKDAIRKAKAEIVEQRKLWQKLGKENAKR